MAFTISNRRFEALKKVTWELPIQRNTKPGQGNMQMSAGEHYKAFNESHNGILAVLFVCLSLMTWSCKTGPSDGNDAEARAEKMLAQMTLDEKIGQMSQLDIGYFSDPDRSQTGGKGGQMRFPSELLRNAAGQ
ncbi:MAG: hypothetical protein MZV63_01615 [Marinilabiliales bacterium]|nr:hypothetical protein [Marinilabiliales bacterium]